MQSIRRVRVAVSGNSVCRELLRHHDPRPRKVKPDADEKTVLPRSIHGVYSIGPSSAALIHRPLAS